jgi:hypothetical protein
MSIVRWADGSSWSKIIKKLAADGLDVLAVPLPLTSFKGDVAALGRVRKAPLY